MAGCRVTVTVPDVQFTATFLMRLFFLRSCTVVTAGTVLQRAKVAD